VTKHCAVPATISPVRWLALLVCAGEGQGRDFPQSVEIPRSGDARGLAKGEAAHSDEGQGAGSRYQTLVVPGMTQERLRRMRRIDGLLKRED
jgi:hypothetical protein